MIFPLPGTFTKKLYAMAQSGLMYEFRMYYGADKSIKKRASKLRKKMASSEKIKISSAKPDQFKHVARTFFPSPLLFVSPSPTGGRARVGGDR
ncbi:MAG: hypothetical protein K9J30_00250 [Bacteroidales bacterium]|nr:hypothetical protein [Bacteroidales bacterium]